MHHKNMHIALTLCRAALTPTKFKGGVFSVSFLPPSLCNKGNKQNEVMFVTRLFSLFLGLKWADGGCDAHTELGHPWLVGLSSKLRETY
jgi:hypothetical protein